MRDAPQLIIRWEVFLVDLIERTNKFPRSIRQSLVQRIDGHGIEVLERLVSARFEAGPAKIQHLKAADVALTRLRILIRLTHRLKHVGHGAYEALMVELEELGQMLGGWRRYASSVQE